mmetsp:Transcript_84971/g.150500  ORF Transcript_84971/g.150500 Transcript_84971/m.150500 type:complete len:88 (-) Transcript_84971:135-398(-)
MRIEAACAALTPRTVPLQAVALAAISALVLGVVSLAGSCIMEVLAMDSEVMDWLLANVWQSGRWFVAVFAALTAAATAATPLACAAL